MALPLYGVNIPCVASSLISCGFVQLFKCLVDGSGVRRWESEREHGRVGETDADVQRQKSLDFPITFELSGWHWLAYVDV